VADKKSRRQRGEGGLYQRASDGMWIGVLDLGWRDGKRRRRTVSAKTQRAAMQKLNEMKRHAHEYGDVPTADITVEKWVAYWLAEIVGPRADPGTYTRYESAAKSHIIPELGRNRLGNHGPQHVRQLHQRIYRLRLSDSTALATHSALSVCLADAMRDGRVPRNVATLVSPPAPTADTEEIALDMDEVRRFMDTAARYPRTWSRWLGAFAIGARQGEYLGLRWSHLDLDGGIADLSWKLERLPYRHGCENESCGRKRASDCPDAQLRVPRGFAMTQLHGRLALTRPKASRRRVPLPEPLRLALVDRQQQVEREQSGYVVDHDLVWCTVDGAPISPEDDYDEWVDWLSASDIPHRKLHAARHTTATLLRNLGYSSDVIKTILGHSTVLQTQAYTEIDVRLAREALAGYSDALALPTASDSSP